MSLDSFSQKLEKVAPMIEEHVRKEIGASEPLPYEIEWPGEEGEGSAYWRSVTGGNVVYLCHFHFDLPGTPSTHLRISIKKDPFSGCSAGPLSYGTRLSKKIGDIAALRGPKPFGLSMFFKDLFESNDEALCEKLNANVELVALANKFSRTKMGVGSNGMQIERLFALYPAEAGSRLIAVTLPYGDELQIKEFFSLAAMIETTL